MDQDARLYRAFRLKQELHLLWYLEQSALAPEHLGAWLAWGFHSMRTVS